MMGALELVGVVLAAGLVLLLTWGRDRDQADHGTAREIGEHTRRALVRADAQRGRDLPCWTWPGGARRPIPPTRHPALIAAEEDSRDDR